MGRAFLRLSDNGLDGRQTFLRERLNRSKSILSESRYSLRLNLDPATSAADRSSRQQPTKSSGRVPPVSVWATTYNTAFAAGQPLTCRKWSRLSTAIERTPNGTCKAPNSCKAALKPASAAWRSGICVTSSREAPAGRCGQRVSTALNDRSSKHSAAPAIARNSSLTGTDRTRTGIPCPSLWRRRILASCGRPSRMVCSNGPVEPHRTTWFSSQCIRRLWRQECPNDFLPEMARDSLGAGMPKRDPAISVGEVDPDRQALQTRAANLQVQFQRHVMYPVYNGGAEGLQ